MAIADFYAESARRAVTEAIGRAEQQTSAEVVVALRVASSTYRAARLMFASLCALVTLVAMLFLPIELPLWSFAFDVTVVFALAAWLAGKLHGVQRGLTPEREREERVHDAACATFLERGVHRCRGRNGVLVYVSVLEQLVEIVPDIGIDKAELAPAHDRLRAAFLAGDVGAFASAIESIGADLAGAHPKGHDDVNELSDDVTG